MNQCQSCKDCCKFEEKDAYYAPIFTQEELTKIKDKNNTFFPFKNSRNIFQIKLIKTKHPKILACPYLNEETHLCEIYEIRPIDCKIWPFLFMHSENKDKILLACWDKDACPKTDKMTQEKYNEYLSEQEKELTKMNMPEFIKKNPEYIWDYEPYTITIKEISKQPNIKIDKIQQDKN